jgi:hypothetical protein
MFAFIFLWELNSNFKFLEQQREFNVLYEIRLSNVRTQNSAPGSKANYKNMYILLIALYPTISTIENVILIQRPYLLTYLLTYSLTHSMVQDILWKAYSPSACQKIVCFLYGIRRFITVLTKVRHWILHWASWIQYVMRVNILATYIFNFMNGTVSVRT